MLLEGSVGGGDGRTFPLQGEETVLGRDPGCGLTVNDSGVSRNHAKLVLSRSGAWLYDLGSRNGTFLNGQRVSTPCELKEGDRIQLGLTTVLQFSLGISEETARQQAALKSAPIAIWECKLTDGSVKWSGQVDRSLGLSPGTLAGRTGRMVDFVTPEDRAAVVEILSVAAAHGAEVSFECRLLVLAQERWVHCKGEVLRGADGRPARIIGTLTDISARKRLELELKKQMALFESLYDGVVVTGLDGRILEWNSSAQTMFGFPREQAQGETLFELLGARNAPLLKDAMALALQSQGRWTAELELRTHQGEVRWCEIVGVLLPGETDERTTCILTHRDVGDRKRLQAQLSSSERLASLGTLSGGIAHEINNPLAFVLANLRFLGDQLLELTPPGGDPRYAECQEVLRETQEGAKRIQDIVQGLKVFSRDERFEDQGPSDLRRAVELGMKLSSNLVRHRARVETQLEALPLVMGGEAKWVQVVVNLLMNASQAIPPKSGVEGVVRVTVRAGPPGFCLLEISDNGAGVPPELRARIFEPFFTTRPIGAGTGLGLSVCHGIVEALGGRIELADDHLGPGTTFRLFAPLAAVEAQPRIAAV